MALVIMMVMDGLSNKIQVAGKRVVVPKAAEISVAHERGEGEEEIEFQLKWEY